MAQIPRAIIGYAARHRTVRNTVEVIAADPRAVRTFTLSAGRPYLPCPDVDGDGYEDRSRYGVLGITPPNVAALKIIGGARNDLANIGSCATTRGILPWRTLGLPPSDTWGNRYTYQADGVFANAIVGFNQNSIADSFDPRLAITASGTNYRKRGGVTLSITRSSVRLTYINGNEAVVVCQGGVPRCQNGTPLSMLLAGNVAGTAFTAPLRNYAVGDVMDGLPFIVVSHGKNGHGAVNHAANIANSAALTVRCNAPLHSPTPVNVSGSFSREAINAPFPHSPGGAGNLCPLLTFDGVQSDEELPHFISQPRTQDGTFDDIVIWRTREELLNSLADKAVLPANDIPLLREF